MKNRIPVVTGQEKGIRDPKLRALVAFYKAFNSRDMVLMKTIWSRSINVRMANPVGGIRKGWKDIASVYKTLFASQHRVYVEFYDFHLLSSDRLFVVSGRERGTLRSRHGVLDLQIRTSRIFHLEGTKWRQVLHHGSIDNPTLLTTYQRIILDH